MPRSALGIVQKYYPQVKRVVDAKHDAQIRVTEADCQASTSKKPSECAMARASQREYEGAVISMGVAYLIRGDKAQRFIVPESITREIVSFDRHHDFAPGTYRLNAPSESKKLAPRVGPMPEDRSGYPTHKKRHVTSGLREL